MKTFLHKHRYVLLITVVSVVVLGIIITVIVWSVTRNTKQIEPVKEEPEEMLVEEKNKLSEETLSAERAGQFNESSATYGQMTNSPNKSLFDDVRNPKFTSVSDDKELKSSDIVASFHIGDDYRAYALKYINYHHLVNDEFGDQPVLISYCGICNSAIAFERTVDGEVLSFGVLGTLVNDNSVMYDRQTDSYWVQVTGEAIEGKYKGTMLEVIPGMELVKYGDFKKAHPDGKVLQPVPGHASDYRNFNQSGFSGSRESAQAIGLEVRGQARAYKIPDIKDKKLINDELNGWSLLILNDPNDNGSRIFRRFLDEQRLEFELVSGKIIDKSTESEWSFNGLAISGELKGAQLEQPNYLELLLEKWQKFYPKTDVYKP